MTEPKPKEPKLKNRREISVEEFEKIANELNIGKGTILDVGCGDNYAKDRIEKLGFHWIGLDPIQQKNISLKGFMEDIPLHNGIITGIFCSHSFEHTTNPIQTIKEFKRVLRRSGLLYLVTPYPTSNQIMSMDKTHNFVLYQDQLNALLQRQAFIIMKTYVIKDIEGYDNMITIAVSV